MRLLGRAWQQPPSSVSGPAVLCSVLQQPSDRMWPCCPYGTWGLSVTILIRSCLPPLAALVRPLMASEVLRILASGELATLSWVGRGQPVCPPEVPTCGPSLSLHTWTWDSSRGAWKHSDTARAGGVRSAHLTSGTRTFSSAWTWAAHAQQAIFLGQRFLGQHA